MVEKTTEVSVVEARPAALQLTEEAIATIQQNIQMAERLVMNVLEKDVDYGIHPGTDSFALRDPGASKIINAFNCYPDHKILYSQETDDIITFQLQANLISRQTGNIVGTGIGSCSTMESKYGFRWIENPEDYGYKREELTRRRRGKYRIPNPEIADLGNTILKMATKRAEVDACGSLPGVGSALKKLFGAPERRQPDWASFWGRVAQLGLSEERVHEMLGVTSVNQWIARGKTLDAAIKVISEKLAAPGAQATKEAPPAEPEGEGFHINLQWLKESLTVLKWSEDTAKSFVVNKYKVDGEGTLTEVLGRLTREQAEDFVGEINSRVGKQQLGLFQ